ncbi:hypothetical protein HYH03_000102 [Edaphochlamys debaryana]|uniref:Uncharacterized protein n=1 Tax=Edaphochlamys debaryana TaxID=47281 RepID=A0A836C7B6_9CHLO|nr:hypothetical protein HYH03_000102 [Edaphochlamys debaryana]|eukprot:KAG2501597.1 hypothetical protein HYH03_000102 [Edaphochlamys debaryana]
METCSTLDPGEEEWEWDLMDSLIPAPPPRDFQSAFPLLSSSSSDASGNGSYVCSEGSLGVCSPPLPAVPLHQHTKPRAATTTSCKGFRICVVRPCGLVHTQRCNDLAAWSASPPPRRSSCSALPSAPIPVPSPSQQACRRRSDPGAVAAAQPFLDLPCPGEGVEAVGRRDPAQNPILVAVRDYYEAYRRQRETAPPHKPPEPCRRVVGFGVEQ